MVYMYHSFLVHSSADGHSLQIKKKKLYSINKKKNKTPSHIAQSVKHLPAMRETWVQSLGSGSSPGERNGNPLQ